jgi:hypothetical protein
MDAVTFFCDCCGHELKEAPYPEGIPSYSICNCCGIEFGFDDYTKAAMLRYRNNWIANGAQWFDPKAKPAGWNLEAQLKRARK